MNRGFISFIVGVLSLFVGLVALLPILQGYFAPKSYDVYRMSFRVLPDIFSDLDVRRPACGFREIGDTANDPIQPEWKRFTNDITPSKIIVLQVVISIPRMWNDNVEKNDPYYENIVSCINEEFNKSFTIYAPLQVAILDLPAESELYPPSEVQKNWGPSSDPFMEITHTCVCEIVRRSARMIGDSYHAYPVKDFDRDAVTRSMKILEEL